MLVLSPKEMVPLTFMSLITPPRVALIPALAAILFVMLELKEMALLIVLPAFNNKVPPIMVTLPVDKFVLLEPPEEMDKVPALIVVPPL